VIAWAGDQRASYVPPVEGPSIQREPLAALLDALDAEGQRATSEDVQRALTLAQYEPGVPSLRASAEPADAAEIEIPRDALAYRGVATLDGFFDKRPERPLMKRRLESDERRGESTGDQTAQINAELIQMKLAGRPVDELALPSGDRPLVNPLDDQFGYAPSRDALPHRSRQRVQRNPSS
jgi:hypothetical protein